MQRTRLVALLLVLGLVALACGPGAAPEETTTTAPPMTPAETTTTPPETTTTTVAETTTTEAIARPERDDKLDIGTVLPETGALAFLGSPQIEGVNLAVEDINAAGGVLGQDVTLATGDSGTDPAVARQTVARHINAGADAVIGAAASGVSQEIIQTLFDNQIVQCSASNTSPSFTDQENNGFYWRTVPPDEAVTPVIVDAVTGDGHTNVAVAARADDYGAALQELVVSGLEGVGATVVADISYDPDADDFSSEVSQIQAAAPEAVVLISFAEGAVLIRQLIEAGLTPDQFYGADGLFGPALDEDVDPGNPAVLEGMKVIGASGSEEFNNRLTERVDEPGNLLYGAQGYDCAVIIALAAAQTESVDPAVFNEAIEGVTKEGTPCASFEECAGLLAEGEDIDYEGASGPLEIAHPDPTIGRYAIGQFNTEGTIDIVGSQDVDLAALGG